MNIEKTEVNTEKVEMNTEEKLLPDIPKEEKKNIKVSINLDNEDLEEGEYELFKGNLNKKDKRIDGDIFLVDNL